MSLLQLKKQRSTSTRGAPGVSSKRQIRSEQASPTSTSSTSASSASPPVRDMNIAKREEDIGFYAGFVGASYFFARTISSVPWGIFADKYGRKRSIMISMLSVIVFNTLFGLSTRYWMAIVTRGLLGLLCGILGPIRAYATEVCRKEHQAIGMSLVTSSRAIAFVVGPAMGGYLAQPAEKYPHIFSKESLFGRFPYFLPCLTISILATGSFIACIWLPETLHFHKDGKVGGVDEEAQISEEVEAQVVLSNIEAKAEVSSDTSMKNLLKNWQFMSSVIIFCIFSVHDVAYLEAFSFWTVSKRKFRGLNFTSQDLATVLAISGIGVLVYQFVVYLSLLNILDQSGHYVLLRSCPYFSSQHIPSCPNYKGQSSKCSQP